jgi:Mn2+/Fe2+ NRAMP family transporter
MQEQIQLERVRTDTYLGMAFSNIIAFFIILDTAAVLHTHGITDIQTSAQAAEALRPLAGESAFLLFSIGIVGTGLIAIPVLAGSAAYALAEALKWPIGLDRQPHRAKGFYGILCFATILGVVMNFTDMNPIKALFWSAVINGVAAAPIMIVMMLMTSNKNITGGLRLPALQTAIGWIATAVMFVVAVAMIATLL